MQLSGTINWMRNDFLKLIDSFVFVASSHSNYSVLHSLVMTLSTNLSSIFQLLPAQISQRLQEELLFLIETLIVDVAVSSYLEHSHSAIHREFSSCLKSFLASMPVN